MARRGRRPRFRPTPVPNRGLVLVDMHLAAGVLGDDGRVVAADVVGSMQVLYHVVVALCHCLARIRTDVDEHTDCLRHVSSFGADHSIGR